MAVPFDIRHGEGPMVLVEISRVYLGFLTASSTRSSSAPVYVKGH
jgi:hypothetical protein